jgi:hypothetical protein
MTGVPAPGHYSPGISAFFYCLLAVVYPHGIAIVSVQEM